MLDDTMAHRFGRALGLPDALVAELAAKAAAGKGEEKDRLRLAFALGTSCSDLYDDDDRVGPIRSSLRTAASGVVDGHWGYAVISVAGEPRQVFPITRTDRNQVEDRAGLEWAMFTTLNNRVVVVHQCEAVELRVVPEKDLFDEARRCLAPIPAVVYEVATELALHPETVPDLPPDICRALLCEEAKIDGDDVLRNVGRTYLTLRSGRNHTSSRFESALEAEDFGLAAYRGQLQANEAPDPVYPWFNGIADPDEIAFVSAPMLLGTALDRMMWDAEED